MIGLQSYYLSDIIGLCSNIRSVCAMLDELRKLSLNFLKITNSPYRRYFSELLVHKWIELPV